MQNSWPHFKQGEFCSWPPIVLSIRDNLQLIMSVFYLLFFHFSSLLQTHPAFDNSAMNEVWTGYIADITNMRMGQYPAAGY